jgi:hypothetical protein
MKTKLQVKSSYKMERVIVAVLQVKSSYKMERAIVAVIVW